MPAEHEVVRSPVRSTSATLVCREAVYRLGDVGPLEEFTIGGVSVTIASPMRSSRPSIKRHVIDFGDIWSDRLPEHSDMGAHEMAR